MIEVQVKLSDTHRAYIADGMFSLEVEGAALYEEPLEIAYRKIEMLYTAAGIAKEELTPEPEFFEGEPLYGDDD